MFIRKLQTARATNNAARPVIDSSKPSSGQKQFSNQPKKTVKPTPDNFLRRDFRKQRPVSGTPANFSPLMRGSLQPMRRPRPQKMERRRGPMIKEGGDSLKIYCLGGQEEVGRNCTVFEYGNDIVILDMGIQFPDEDMLGIDYIIPNAASLENKKDKIRGVIFSHGHLDHIGAAPMMLEQLGNPTIIGRQLTLALIKNRQEDYKHGTAQKLKT
ncbi:MAG: MBL fold metallo-hydrolase, partial [Patescibacteria group bacterium]